MAFVRIPVAILFLVDQYKVLLLSKAALNRYLYYVPWTGWVWRKEFLGGSGRRAVAQTHLAVQKMPPAQSAFP